jgi:hypothetical protein
LPGESNNETSLLSLYTLRSKKRPVKTDTKNKFKVVALFLTLAFLLSVSVPSFANGNSDITADNAATASVSAELQPVQAASLLGNSPTGGGGTAHIG